MKVRELMTSDVGYCREDANLTAAATIMWQRDCGVVPVVDENKRVVGMLTDRDICIALASKNRLASEITAGEVIYGEIKSCLPGDDAEDALKKMRKSQLRRLPVITKDGVLVGIVSISDFLRHAGKGNKKVSRRKVYAALEEISQFRPLRLHILTAEDADEPEIAAEPDLIFGADEDEMETDSDDLPDDLDDSGGEDSDDEDETSTPENLEIDAESGLVEPDSIEPQTQSDGFVEPADKEKAG